MIKISNLSKTFKNQMVLENVNLEIEEGTITGFVGRNGSGKTVLFKMIAGLTRPSSGEITVNGIRVGKDRDFPDKMGIIIETPNFISFKSGYENLESLAVIRRQIGEEEIRKAMELVGLANEGKKKVGKYSLGMRQRLGIAQAIMENPELLILDEPMNGLDEEGVEEIRSLLQDLKKEGKTILLASHNKEDIQKLCDRVYHLSGGKLEESRAENE